MKPWTRRALIIVFLVVTVGLALQQWSAPSGDWACDESPRCVSTVAIDLEALDFDGALIGWQSFDLSPDGREIVVALITSESPIRNDERLLIGTFSTDSGELISTLVTVESVEYVAVDEVRYSPDGSMIAAVWYQSVGQLQVFDAADGSLRSTVIETDGSDPIRCNGALGFAASNAVLHCGSVAFDISSGEVVQQSTNGRPLAATRGGSIAHAASGLVADGFGQREIDILTPAGEQVSVIDPAGFPDAERSLMTFAETNAGKESVVLVQDVRSWSWVSGSPRRSHPEARLSVYSIESGQLEWSQDLADRTEDVAVNGRGLVAAISADGRVTIYDLS